MEKRFYFIRLHPGLSIVFSIEMEKMKPGRKRLKIQTMSSNLPLLFVDSKPTTLDSMTEAQLEKFVCFMTHCSFIQKDSGCQKNEKKPKWWPIQVPYKIPPESGYPSNFNNRKAMLKTLVCCCYTFYNCEFLLKFSSELAEMKHESLSYVPSTTGNITLIYTRQGTLLVKCRNENLTYDQEGPCGVGLQNRAHTKNVCATDKDEVKCIDVTDSLSESNKENHLKQRAHTKNVCATDKDEVKCIDVSDSLSENDEENHLKQRAHTKNVYATDKDEVKCINVTDSLSENNEENNLKQRGQRKNLSKVDNGKSKVDSGKVKCIDITDSLSENDEEIHLKQRGQRKNLSKVDNGKVKCIDISDSLSENDEQIHLKQGTVGIKRKLCGRYKTLNNKRPCYSSRREQPKAHIEVIDLTDEPPLEVPVDEKANFLNGFGLISIEELKKQHENFNFNKKFVKTTRRSCAIPFSTKCGQAVYINNNQASSSYHFNRANRYCSTMDLSKMQPVPEAEESSDDELKDDCNWTHTYKPGRRCQTPQRLHRGPSLKPCIVKLTRLTDEEIQNFNKKIKFVQKPGRGQFCMKTACPQLRMTEGFGLESIQNAVKTENLPVLKNKQPVVQNTKLVNTINKKNLRSVSRVKKHVGYSDSKIGNVTGQGNGDALHFVEEHPISRGENNKSMLELKCSFPSNYLTHSLKNKINKRLTNPIYEPVCRNLKYLPRKLSLSKRLDNAIEWYTQRNGSGIKRSESINSQRLQENLVPVEDIMCAVMDRANGKDI